MFVQGLDPPPETGIFGVKENKTMKKIKFESAIFTGMILMAIGFSNQLFAAQSSQYSSQDTGQAIRVKQVIFPKPVKESASRSLAARASSLTNVKVVWPITKNKISVKKNDTNTMPSSHYLAIDESGTVKSSDLNTGNYKNYFVELWSPTASAGYHQLVEADLLTTQDADTFSFKFDDIPIYNIPKSATKLNMRLIDRNDPNKVIQQTQFNLPKRPNEAYQPQILNDGFTTASALQSWNNIKVSVSLKNVKWPENYVVPARIVSEVLDTKGKVMAGTTQNIDISHLDNFAFHQTLNYGTTDKLKGAVSLRLKVVQANGAVLGSPVIISIDGILPAP